MAVLATLCASKSMILAIFLSFMRDRGARLFRAGSVFSALKWR
jgi:hypothetical protein